MVETKGGLPLEDWLRERRSGIGGSDAAAAVGLNPYKTPFQLWQEKTGEREPDDISDKPAVHFGIVLEDVIATEYATRFKRKIERRKKIFRHPDFPFMLANIDRLIVDKDRGPGILDAKTAGHYAARDDKWGPSGTDLVPEEYLIQLQHYLAVTGCTWGDIAVLIAGQDFRTYHFTRNESLIAVLIEKETAFWNCVIEKRPPMINTEADARLKWPKSFDRPIEATTEIADHVINIAMLKKSIEVDTARLDQLKSQVMDFMGEADTLTTRDGRKLATWKSRREFIADAFAREMPEEFAKYMAPRFDESAFRKARPDLVEKFKLPSKTRAFTISKEDKA